MRATTQMSDRQNQHATEVSRLREQTRAIQQALTGEPQWVPEWQEYAATTLAGGTAYGQSYAECAERKREADEVWAKHNSMGGRA